MFRDNQLVLLHLEKDISDVYTRICRGYRPSSQTSTIAYHGDTVHISFRDVKPKPSDDNDERCSMQSLNYFENFSLLSGEGQPVLHKQWGIPHNERTSKCLEAVVKGLVTQVSDLCESVQICRIFSAGFCKDRCTES